MEKSKSGLWKISFFVFCSGAIGLLYFLLLRNNYQVCRERSNAGKRKSYNDKSGNERASPNSLNDKVGNRFACRKKIPFFRGWRDKDQVVVISPKEKERLLSQLEKTYNSSFSRLCRILSKDLKSLDVQYDLRYEEYFLNVIKCEIQAIRQDRYFLSLDGKDIPEGNSGVEVRRGFYVKMGKKKYEVGFVFKIKDYSNLEQAKKFLFEIANVREEKFAEKFNLMSREKRARAIKKHYEAISKIKKMQGEFSGRKITYNERKKIELLIRDVIPNCFYIDRATDTIKILR